MDSSFGASNCNDVIQECHQLVNSTASFNPYPHEKRICLALSGQLSLPAQLTLERGLCQISCQGGHLPGCNTTKLQFNWKNMSTPFCFENCPALYHYCVYITIGGSECCPTCTQTVFMEDYNYQISSEEILPWRSVFAAVVLILFVIGLTMIIVKHIFIGKVQTNWMSINNGQQSAPITYNNLSKRYDGAIFFLYLKEKNDHVRSLQEFLKNEGLDIIDVYKEEDLINVSLINWIENIRNRSLKTLIVDSDLLRNLLYSKAEYLGAETPVEKAVRYYIHTCLHNLQTQVYLVRTKELLPNERCLSVWNERCYIYPTHAKRLLEDLTLEH